MEHPRLAPAQVDLPCRAKRREVPTESVIHDTSYVLAYCSSLLAHLAHRALMPVWNQRGFRKVRFEVVTDVATLLKRLIAETKHG